MTSLAETFEHGLSYAEMVSGAAKNADLFAITRRSAAAPEAHAARIAATGRTWHLLSISEDWCGDSVNTLPWVDALAACAPNLDHRIIRRDEHVDLMDRHLTNGRTRSIPIVLLLDERYVERAWWGPRTTQLQAWFEGAESQAMSKEEQYKVLRTRTVRDRGRSILEEITAMIEETARQDEVGASVVATPQAAS